MPLKVIQTLRCHTPRSCTEKICKLTMKLYQHIRILLYIFGIQIIIYLQGSSRYRLTFYSFWRIRYFYDFFKCDNVKLSRGRAKLAHLAFVSFLAYLTLTSTFFGLRKEPLPIISRKHTYTPLVKGRDGIIS